MNVKMLTIRQQILDPAEEIVLTMHDVETGKPKTVLGVVHVRPMDVVLQHRDGGKWCKGWCHVNAGLLVPLSLICPPQHTNF
jgi:hypothetical protein